jgi:hypothetical protein
MRPSEVQYASILCSYFSFDNVCVMLVLNCVRFFITWLRPMSFKSNSIPSLSLQILITRSSVCTGWIIFPWLPTGTRTLWNLRLIRHEYCSWLSSLDTSSASFLHNDYNSASCFWQCFHFALLVCQVYRGRYTVYIFSLYLIQCFWLVINSLLYRGVQHGFLSIS